MAKYVYRGPDGPFTAGETYDLVHAPANADDWQSADTPAPDPTPEPAPTEPTPEETP